MTAIFVAALASILPAFAQSGDTTPPSVTSIEIDLATATPTTAEVIVTFSEPVTGVDISDFAMNGLPNAAATITAVNQGATAAMYNVAFSYTGTSGSLQMAIRTTGTGIADLAGNAFVGHGVAASAPVSVNAAPPADMTVPGVSSFAPPAGPITSPANLTLVFNESVTGVTADDFLVSEGGTIGSITGSGTTWTVPVSFTGTTPITVTVIGGATADIRDAATHWFAGGSAAATATITPGSEVGAVPVITSPLTASVTAGASFSYTIEATNSPTTFAATGLPDGLTFTSPTISGSVAVPGTYSITIGVENTAGSDSEALVLTVNPVDAASPPAITSPLTATITAGEPFSYTITASNAPTSFTATGLPDGLTFTSPTIGGSVAAPGMYSIAIGAANAAGSDSETLVLTVQPADSEPDPGKGDGPVTVLKLRGEAMTLPETTADGKPIQWVLVSGNATLVDNVLTPKNRGAVVVRAFVEGSTTPLVNFDIEREDPAPNGKPKARRDRLSNVSSRLRISRADPGQAAIAGFVVTGEAKKQVLVRAVGPGLAAFNVPNTAAGVELRLFDQSGNLVAQNDGWKSDAAIAATAKRVGAFDLAAGSNDAALLATLAPGVYTAHVGADTEGIALVEVYDATNGNEASTEQLINLSTRGHVGTGDGSLIAGFVVSGDAPKRILIRGIGPALAGFDVSGALPDPVLELYTASGMLLVRNDDWEAAEVETAASASGAFPLTRGSKDAAIVMTLMPGLYNAVVRGANDTTGTGLVEVYEVPEF